MNTYDKVPPLMAVPIPVTKTDIRIAVENALVPLKLQIDAMRREVAEIKALLSEKKSAR